MKQLAPGELTSGRLFGPLRFCMMKMAVTAKGRTREQSFPPQDPQLVNVEPPSGKS